MKPVEGRKRVIIEDVQPQVDCGRYPAKRTLGDIVTVTAAIFADGHDHVAGRLLFRHENERDWRSTPMTRAHQRSVVGDFTVDKPGTWHYTIEAWVDHFDTWCADLQKRLAAQHDPAADPATASQNIPLALRTGALLLEDALPPAPRAPTPDCSTRFSSRSAGWPIRRQTSPNIHSATRSSTSSTGIPISPCATRYHQELALWVDRERARFSTWYELFPRSTSPDPGRHGTFADVEALLPEIAAMGFDVLYLPPIHPIGDAFRKGRNNNVVAAKGDPGSPWAIGSKEGGHTAIHPQLGTLADFDHLVAASRAHGMEIALDIAFQCSPDHPWVSEHPDWFIKRPDGSIQYAENPPKKYQDIYPLNFESPSWRASLGGAPRRLRLTGSTTASASSASTIPTPRRCPSGSGASPRFTRNIPT